MTKWSLEADYFTACNCDWGCPCNFNARPSEGRCMGLCVWNVLSGRFGNTDLAGTRFALYYKFPGPGALHALTSMAAPRRPKRKHSRASALGKSVAA